MVLEAKDLHAYNELMSTETDVDLLAARCDELFDLGALVLPPEYRYASVGHCILDAVFSISVKYSSTRLVVDRYCNKRGIAHYRPAEALPATKDQEPLSAFVAYLESQGPEVFAAQIVENRQRTSPRSGILKAEACLRFAKVLRVSDVEFFQDLAPLALDGALETQLRAITGMSSGIAIQYFWMLAGSQDLIKPDRMILRFIQNTLSRPFTSTTEAARLLIAAAQSLQLQYSSLNARVLDYAVWDYQRQQPAADSNALSHPVV
jgi:hypothetical protein